MHARSHSGLQAPQHRPQNELGILAILFLAQSIPKALTDNCAGKPAAPIVAEHSDSHVPKNIHLSSTGPKPRPRLEQTPQSNRAPLLPPRSQILASQTQGAGRPLQSLGEIQRGGFTWPGRAPQQRRWHRRWGPREVKGWADEGAREQGWGSRFGQSGSPFKAKTEGLAGWVG